MNAGEVYSALKEWKNIEDDINEPDEVRIVIMVLQMRIFPM